MNIKLPLIVKVVLAAIIRFFTPTIASITRDFERKIVKLNKLIDELNAAEELESATRDQLHKAMVASYDRSDARYAEASKATAIRMNLEKIVNV